MENPRSETLPAAPPSEEREARTIWLRDPAQAWLVTEGSVDVFALLLRDEVVVGGLRHLFRAEAGQLLLGADWPGPGGALAMQARGSADARLRPVALEQLRALAESPEQLRQAAGWLESWIAGVAAAVAPELLPKKVIGLAPGDELVLLPGAVAASAGGVVWIEQREGGLALLGLPAGQEPGAALPLAGQLYARADAPCEVGALDTEACLRRGLAWAGLAAFQAAVGATLSAQLARQAQAERARIEAIGAVDRQAMGRSLERLAAVLNPTAAPADGPGQERDPLFAACRLVGGAVGIDVRRPAARAGAGRRDPLAAIARASRARVRRVALRGDWWRRDSGPLLATRTADGQPVALIPERPGRYRLHDPAGAGSVPLGDELAAELEPFAYSFFRTLPARPLAPIELLRFGLRGCERDLARVLLTGAGLGLLGLATPIVTGVIVDAVIPGANRLKLLQLSLALVVAAFASIMFQVVQRIALLRVEARANSATQAAVWDRLLNLPAPFFRQYSAGDLATRVAGIDAIRQTLTGITVSTLLAGIFALLNLGLLFAYDPRGGLVALGLVLLSSAVTLAAGYVSLRYTRDLNKLRAKLAGMVLQFLTGIARLRAAGAERRAFGIWAEQFAAQRRVAYRARTVSNGLSVFNAAFPGIALIAIFASLAAGDGGQRSTGTVLAFVSAFSGMLAAALAVSASALAVLQIVPLIESARPIFATAPELDEQRADPPELTGSIEVSRVTFRYQPDGPPILDDVSLQASPGEFVAIVGPSGSGKSTLLRLLLGFETPETGAIYYDGSDLAGLDLQAVRAQLGVVLQSSRLMPGDIFSNIVGSSLLTLEDAWGAAERAGLADDIRQMPMGMQTVIGEGGSTFSGGQRQRLLIARAIVRRPRILLFDEATSALDNRTQAVVSRSLEQLRATRVVIAHRLSTIMNADRIYVMVGGRVEQSGTFAELSARDGPFRELVRRQTL